MNHPRPHTPPALWRWLIAALAALALLAAPALAADTGQIDTADIRNDAITDAELDTGLGAGQVNAADVPVIDAAAHYVAATVEGVLAEIGTWLNAHPVYWQRITGPVAGLRPLVAADDLYLGSNEQAVLQSETATEQKLAAGIIGEDYPRVAITAGGALQFGSGAAAPDVDLTRVGSPPGVPLPAGLELNTSLTATSLTATGPEYGGGVYGAGYEYGVRGAALDNSNDTWGGIFDRTNVGDWADFVLHTTHPAAPDAPGYRLYSSRASVTGYPHLFQRANDVWGGTAVDLVAPVVFQVDGRALATGASGTYWHSQKPSAATGLAAITPSATSGANYTSRYLTTCHGQWAWTSTATGSFPPRLAAQADLSLGFGFAKRPLGTYPADQQQTSRVIVRARVRVNDTARLSSLYLVLNDVGAADDTPASGASANVLGSLTSGQWAVVTLASPATATDVSSWGTDLRCGLIAYGTTTPANVGATTVSVEWIAAELYPL